MSERRRKPLIALLVVLLAAGALLAAWWRLTAPAPETAVRADLAALAEADPTAQWWATRALPAPLPAETAVPLPEPVPVATPDLAPELGRVWDAVRNHEAALLASGAGQPKSSRTVAPGVEESLVQLAADYLVMSQARADLGADRYSRAIDDHWPAWHLSEVYPRLAAETPNAVLAQVPRAELSPAVLQIAEVAARQHARRGWQAEVRTEATRTAYQVELDQRLAAFDAAWDATLDDRLAAIERELVRVAEQTPSAPALLNQLPPMGSSEVPDEFRRLLERHAEHLPAPPARLELLETNPAEAALLKALWADYEALRSRRIEAALEGLGYRAGTSGPDATGQLNELLYPQAAPGEEGRP